MTEPTKQKEVAPATKIKPGESYWFEHASGRVLVRIVNNKLHVDTYLPGQDHAYRSMSFPTALSADFRPKQ